MIDSLKEALATAREELAKARQARDEFILPRKEAIEAARADALRKLYAEADANFGAAITAADKAKSDARLALDAARVAAAISNAGWLPAGTVVAEWTRPYKYGMEREARPTGRLGKIEVWSDQSVRPNRLRWQQRPDPGDIIIRLLKKDGTESKVFEAGPLSWLRDSWRPHGAKPEAK
jgi:hypothetical protein